MQEQQRDHEEKIKNKKLEKKKRATLVRRVEQVSGWCC